MANLRILNITVVDSTTIQAQFTDKLSRDIGTSNINLVPQLDSVPVPDVLSVDILGDTMTITVQPLTPVVAYYIVFSSNADRTFQSLNGTSVLYEDGVTNRQLILGPAESDNFVQDFLINYFRKNIFEVTDTTTLVNKVVQAFSIFLSKTIYDVRQSKNENYVSFMVKDEQHTRGFGPFDRLLEEGAYEVTRIGKTPTITPSIFKVKYDIFPTFPITLQAQAYEEDLTAVSVDGIGTFNINDFIITTSNQNVTKLTSVTFIYNDTRPAYVYNIETLGYQILDSRYDQDFGYSYLLLGNDQFKLSESILQDTNFSTQKIARVDIKYEYKNLGRIIDAATVQTNTILSSIRETLPPIINVFNLAHAPITDSQGNAAVKGAVTFIDPNALDSTRPHPAFIYETSFSFDALPNKPGEYAIDYTSGTVYVFGSDQNNSGTGPLPPLATYNYNYIYKSEVDYVYDQDFNDIIALPFGSLVGNEGTITFNYEEVLIPGIDYVADVHVESLSERINNKLVAINCFKTQHSPITNVFRIFNETSGEIYNTVRWSADKVFFSYNTPPSIAQGIAERVTFADVLNEILFVSNKLTNTSSLTIYKFLLNNNNIISATEDSIGSFINSSVRFSDVSVFATEKWFDSHSTEALNIDRLETIGQYQIDYVDGIVYCAVASDQSLDVGAVSYKSNSITPQFPHLISVDDIYNRISILNPKDKFFTYSSFGDGFIYPSDLNASDEGYFNSNESSAYVVSTNQIGVFSNGDFVPGLAGNVGFLRGIYSFDDLKNNTYPLNFATSSSFSGTIVDLEPIVKQEYSTVQHNVSDGYYVTIETNLSYLSNAIMFTPSVLRNSDSAQLWDNSGVVGLGSPVKLKLSGVNSPQVNDPVTINYTFEIVDLTRVIVDYNRGDLFIDYTYLVDEIIVSYEYGENQVDFRKSRTVSTGDTYYATYKVGALRDGLLDNFGTLINVPELANLDVNLNRERYRDAISAALESFIQGPTLAAIENIGEKITHIKPEIIESVFQSWSLGTSLLTPQSFQTTGTFQLLPAKHGNGIVLNRPDQTVTLPASSNLKLESGTFESWIIPEWDGIDNSVELKINVTKDGYALPSNRIFIGAGEFHPRYDQHNGFVVDKLHNASGKPNLNKDGVFIYHDFDASGLFKRWFFQIIDGYGGGAVNRNYSVKIGTPGLFYDFKSLTLPKPSNLSITSGTNKASFTVSGTSLFNEGVTFVADREYYLFDVGLQNNRDRISLYKDPSGYVNLRVYDKFKNVYAVSANVSSWKASEPHHIAASWALNTKNNRDELHLFIDGFEVPNIIKYGNKIGPYLHEKFRTINPEEIAGVISQTIVSSNDLVTTAGSNQVSSSINFSGYGINVGNVINIDEVGFDPDGYVITNVNGNALTLSAPMPFSLTDGRFTVNRTRLNVQTEIDVFPNVAVSTLISFLDGYDLTTVSSSDTVHSGLNFETLGVVPGNLLRIDSPGYENHYVILNVNDGYLVVNDSMPSTLSSASFFIYPGTDVEIPGLRALRPSYSLSQDGYDGYVNNVLVLNNDVSPNDLILIKTFGLNHRRIKQKYYQWGDTNNVIQTVLPPPISLDSVGIFHTIFPTTLIKAAPLDGYNATAVANVFTSNVFTTDQPSVSDTGRTLSVTISTTNNLDFTTPVLVTISGSPGSEVLTFNAVGTKNTTSKFTSVTGIQVTGKTNNSNKAIMTLSAQEAKSITIPEDSARFPVLKYSYQTNAGITLTGSGSDILTDTQAFFSVQDIGNYLIINSPAPAAGTYQILGISNQNKSIQIDSILPAFTNGHYQVLNSSTFRSGFQNGFFLLEDGYAPTTPYALKQGVYEFDFYTYLSIKLNPIDTDIFFGSDRLGHAQLTGMMDEIVITGNKLTDTRVGEVVQANQQSITKDFNALKALKSNVNTLVLAHLDTFPFTNDAAFYISQKTKGLIQSGYSLNDNFSNSIYFTNNPYVIENEGILNTKNEGTIEFWVSPIHDTANDPNYRFYFDAAGTMIENVTSLSNVTVQVSGRIGKVLSVKALYGDPSIDYFAGGRVEIDTQGAVSESSVSTNSNTVVVTRKVLQVITVKIVNDPTNTDYFQGGSIGTDKQTLYLGRTLPGSNVNLIITYKLAEGGDNTLNTQVIRLNQRLPNQQTPVVVTYIPSGMQGDRISIFKDPSGFINFAVTASGTDYVIQAPVFWARNTWHRLKATFKVNSGKATDQIRFFIDGYERGNALFGTGLVLGSPMVFGSSSVGTGGITANIKFKDFLNELYIGGDFTGRSGAYALIDNLRISNLARPVFAPFGESIDVNYNSNIDVAFPVTEDLYTTLLLDFESLLVLNTDFVTLNNKKSASFNFSVNIFDSFGIVEDSPKVKEVLETLIKVLKPANSRVFLKYIK